jgi:hypothetical protein
MEDAAAHFVRPGARNQIDLRSRAVALIGGISRGVDAELGDGFCADDQPQVFFLARVFDAGLIQSVQREVVFVTSASVESSVVLIA